MKRSSLTTAVLAGLAGVVGFASSSNAVELNPDGTGEALVYPYYTVNAGQQTQISVVNSTDIAKAVKVRFLEGYNSREVLDFNLFLSPYDVWTASIFALADDGGSSDAAAVATTDVSCTDPGFGNLPTNSAGAHYQAFLPFAYTGENADTGPSDLARTREGYAEIIAMADLTGDTAAAVTHVGGVPADCSAVQGLTAANADMIPPTGGLFGAGAVVNVGDGTMYSYNADAVAGFSGTVLFARAGSTSPNLADANSGPAGATAFVFGDEGELFTANYPTGQNIDAVSAVFESNAILNEYVINGGAQAGTDWVVTFPTKRFYVDPQIVGASAIQPFVETFGENADGNSCTVIDTSIYDREEGTTGSAPGGFSPPAPGTPASSLCHEVNVITFAGDSILGSTELASNLDLVDPAGGSGPFAAAGWMRLNLNPTDEPHVMRPSNEGYQFQGLPATGFEAVRYMNANAEPGKLANYSGLFRHRVERSCVINGVPCS